MRYGPGGHLYFDVSPVDGLLRPEDMNHVHATITEFNELKAVVADLAAKVAVLEAARIARGGTP